MFQLVQGVGREKEEEEVTPKTKHFNEAGQIGVYCCEMWNLIAIPPQFLYGLVNTSPANNRICIA